MNICFITYSFYESDPRIRRVAESLALRGDKVDVICLRRKGMMKRDYLDGVNVYRIQQRQINERNPVDYLKKLLSFFLLSSFMVTKLFLSKRYNLIHVASEPDFEVFSTFIPKLFGAKVILDIHELVPEIYARKFNLNENYIVVKILKWVEKISCKFADHVITVTDIWKNTLTKRSIPESKCTVLLNLPDPRVFKAKNSITKFDNFTIVCRGVFSEPYGLDIAIRALDIIRQEIPSVKLEIMGEGCQNPLLKLVTDLKLEGCVHFNKITSVYELAAIMQQADMGIDPRRDGIYAGETLSAIIFELMTMGIPVVISRTKASKKYFNESIVMFFEPDNCHDLARCVIELHNNPQRRQKLVKNGDRFIKKHNWEGYRKIYCDLVDTLCRG